MHTDSGAESGALQAQPAMRPDLGRTDFTLLVIGAVIGADIYVVAALGAKSLGPAQLVAWVAAGALAVLIAFAFVQCAAIDTDVGGSYTYARRAFGPLAGFVAGWALYVGELVALPVFPLAFVSYLDRLLPSDLPSAGSTAVKAALIGMVTASNFFGARRGARLNDVLSIAKLIPLAALIVVALVFTIVRHSDVSAHVHPFAPLGWGGFGTAIVPIFWAYAGFELAVLPAGEVRDAKKTLPIGLLVGMTVAIIFYLLTAYAVVAAIPWQVAAASPGPLAPAMRAMTEGLGGPGAAGVAMISVGALISIAGVYEAFTLGVARLSYALAADGLFPSPFARLHQKYDTPYAGLMFQAAYALIGSTLFDLRGLITIAVFFLSISYILTALAALRLVRQHPEGALRVPGLRAVLVLSALASLYLASQTSLTQFEIGAAVMLAGFVLYAVRGDAWRRIAHEVGAGEHTALRWAERRDRWLLRSLRRSGRRAS